MKRLSASLALFESPWAAPLALGAGVALRVLALVALADVPLRADMAIYVAMARQLLAGESFPPYHPPGLSFLLLPAHALLGPSDWVARLAMIALYVATSFLLQAQTRALAGKRAAGFAVAAFALYPTSVWLSVEPLTQMPTAACLLAIAWLAPGLVTRPRVGAALALGLAAGELALIRPSALPFVAAIPLYLAVRGVGLRTAGVTLAAAALCVGLWLAHAREMAGRFVWINDANSLNFFIGNNDYTPLYKTWWFGSHAAGEAGVPEAYSALERELEGLPPAERDRRYRDEALTHIETRPELFALRTFNRVRVYLAFDSSTAGWMRLYGLVGTAGALAVMAAEAAFYLAFVCGALLMCLVPPAARSGRERLAVAAGAALLYAAPYFVAFSHPTYHFPVVALCVSLAAAFAERTATEPAPGPLASLWAAPRRRAWLLAALVALALIQIEWLAMNADRLG